MKLKLHTLLATILLATSLTAFAAPLKKITFATEATYPPFETISAAGEIQGFDIDVAKAVCQELKTQCVFVNQPFDSLIPSLQMGKFDAIIAAMNITPERAKVVNFTDAYYKNTVSFVALKNVTFDLTPGKFKQKSVGVQQGTTLANYLKSTYGDAITVKTYASQESAFLDLESGRVDAVMGDTPLIQQWIKEHGNNKFHTIGQPINDIKFFGQGYGIAIKKGNAKLLQKLNQAIDVLNKNGTIEKIKRKYGF